MLTGRQDECRSIDALLEGARASRGGALVVRGEAGLGKSALLDYAAAGGLRTLRCTGVQAESEFAFASAHQLLQPLLPLVDGLPPPQARALGVALGTTAGGRPDPFLVALGLLSLLSDAAREQPLLCLVDDVQWCDSSSTAALLFAVRRLTRDPVALLFSAREDAGTVPFALPGVSDLALTGLTVDEGRALLDDVTGTRVAQRVAAVLVRRTRGNPLALLEGARALSAGQLRGTEELPDPLPVGDHLEQAFLDRARRLPDEVQHLLLLVAAEESGQADLVLAAAGPTPAAEAAMAQAEASGLLVRRLGSLELCHPLARSAIYRDAAPSARRAAHRALADRLGERGEEDRQTWHLASAGSGTDQQLSARLETLAQRAAGRSGYGAASAGFERAADFSTATTDVTRLLVAAADAAWLAGQAPRARDLVHRAEPGADDPLVRARLLHLRARAASRNGDVDAAYRSLLEGMRLAAEREPALALEMCADAVEAAMYRGDARLAEDAARRARDLDAGDGVRQRFLSAWLAATGQALQDSSETSADAVRAALSLTDDLDDPRLLTWAGIAAVNLGDIAMVAGFFRRAVRSARSSGAVASLPYPLEKWAMTEALAGNYASARSAAEEGLRLAHETEQLGSACHLQATLALVAATCGDEQECRRQAGEALGGAVPRGLGLPIANATWAAGRLDLGLGRHADALDHLRSMQTAGPGRGNALIALWSTPDLVEAAVRAGRHADVTGALARLDGWAAASGRRTVLAGAARCHALLGDPDALAMLGDAADTFGAADSPYEEGRTRLVLGELLRRQRSRGDAREQLRAAFGIFERLGARPWAQRAATELRATGEAVRPDAGDGVARLTPQELQIIRHVCEGASNRDVAAQLFISPRTVEYHLYKVYPKLGVTSRSQLIRRYGAVAESVRLP